MADASSATARTIAQAPPSPIKDFWNYFSENRGAVAASWSSSIFLFIAIFAPMISPYAPDVQFRDALAAAAGLAGRRNLAVPARHRSARARHALAADPRRAVLVLHRHRRSSPSRPSVGVLIGVIAGFAPTWLDTLIMRVMDIMLSFPSLLLALVLVAILGPSLLNAMIAIAIVLQPHFVRLTRAAVHLGAHARLRHRPRASPGRASCGSCSSRSCRTASRRSSCRRRCPSRPRSSTPRRSASSAWARSRPRPNGARCWPRRASSSCAPGGW